MKNDLAVLGLAHRENLSFWVWLAGIQTWTNHLQADTLI
jgi:hypothetical protein